MQKLGRTGWVVLSCGGCLFGFGAAL